MRYALIHNDVFVEFREFGPTPEDLPQKNIRFLPAPDVAHPVFDSATQALEGPTFAINPTEYTMSWNVRTKTQAELDEDQTKIDAAADDLVVNTVEGMVGKAMFKIVNEIRTLQSASQLTPDQFKTWFRNQQI